MKWQICGQNSSLFSPLRSMWLIIISFFLKSFCYQSFCKKSFSLRSLRLCAFSTVGRSLRSLLLSTFLIRESSLTATSSCVSLKLFSIFNHSAINHSAKNLFVSQINLFLYENCNIIAQMLTNSIYYQKIWTEPKHNLCGFRHWTKPSAKVNTLTV